MDTKRVEELLINSHGGGRYGTKWMCQNIVLYVGLSCIEQRVLIVWKQPKKYWSLVFWVWIFKGMLEMGTGLVEDRDQQQKYWRYMEESNKKI